LTGKRICVTGGAGFLGSFLVEELRRRGCTEIFIPRRRDYDLTTAAGIDKLFADARPEIIFHLAGVVGGIGANCENPGRFFYENAVMGVQLIEAARKTGVEKTIVAGTTCSYPKFAPVPFREDSLWDGYPDETNAPYGIAKKALLIQCQTYRRQYGMNAVYLMPVNLYGPRDNFDLRSSHVIPALIRKCLEAKERGDDSITCWGDGSATRAFLYAPEAAEGLALAGELYDGPEPVNLGAAGEVSIHDLVSMIAKLCKFEGEIKWDASQPNGQPRRALDGSRAERYFGFVAKIPLEEGLATTIEWYRQTGAKSQPSS
jgi:GDP-L-fucose synthase